MNVHFDMETQDPDDVLALCVLATHPRVKLRSVTLMPGSSDQVGVVRHVLDRMGRQDVVIGAWGCEAEEAKHVSAFHYRWLGKIACGRPDTNPITCISNTLDANPDCHLITGAALTNVWDACQARGLAQVGASPDLSGYSWAPTKPFFKTWTCQGGFAGDNVVPESYRLKKFKGRLTCPTFNLNGNPEAAKGLMATMANSGGKIDFVSKNVCHGVIHDKVANQTTIPLGAHAGLDMLQEGMKVYTDRKPAGKALHDVIAVAAAIDPSIVEWASVKLYREKGEWGSELDPNSNQRISTYLDVGAFYGTLAA